MKKHNPKLKYQKTQHLHKLNNGKIIPKTIKVLPPLLTAININMIFHQLNCGPEAGARDPQNLTAHFPPEVCV